MPLLQSTKDLISSQTAGRDLYWSLAKKAGIGEAKINKALKEYKCAERDDVEEGIISYLNTLPDLDKLILFLEIKTNFVNSFQPKYKNKVFKFKKSDLEDRSQLGALQFKHIIDDPDCLWFLENVNGPFNEYYFHDYGVDAEEEDKPEINKQEMLEIEDKLCKRFVETVVNHEKVPLTYRSYGNDNPLTKMTEYAYKTTDNIDKLHEDLNVLGYFPKKAATSFYAQAQMKRGQIADKVLKNLSITDDTWNKIPITVELLQKLSPLKALGILSRYEHSISAEDVKRILFPLINSSRAKEYGERVTTLLREMGYDFTKIANKLLEKPCAMNYKTGVNLTMSDFVNFIKSRSKDPAGELAEFIKHYFRNTSYGQRPYVRDAIDELLEGKNDQ